MRTAGTHSAQPAGRQSHRQTDRQTKQQEREARETDTHVLWVVVVHCSRQIHRKGARQNHKQYGVKKVGGGGREGVAGWVVSPLAQLSSAQLSDTAPALLVGLVCPYSDVVHAQVVCKEPRHGDEDVAREHPGQIPPHPMAQIL